jgi:O-antigen ligase
VFQILVREKLTPLYILGFLLAVMVGVLSSIYQGVALITGVIILLVGLKIKPNFIFKCTLVGLMVIPFGTYYFFKVQIPYIKVDIFNIVFYFLIALLLTQWALSKRIRSIKIDFSFVMWVGVVITYFTVGLLNHEEYLASESKIFMLFIVYILADLFLTDAKNSFKTFIKITTIASFFLSILVILMYFFKFTLFATLYEGTFYSHGTRVGTGNQSIFIIGIPLLMTALRLKIFHKWWNFYFLITITLTLISVIISESRVLIASTLVNMGLTYFLNISTDKKSSFGMKYLKILNTFVIIACLFFVISFTSLGNNTKILSVMERFNEFFQTGTSDSMGTREMTNQNTLYLIKQNIMGHGIGAPMDLINSKGAFVSSGSFIDNGFLTVLYKFGILGLIIFLLFYIRNFRNVYKTFINNPNEPSGKFALTILMSLPLFIVNCMVYTTQLVMNGSVFCFILFIFALYNTQKNELVKKKKFKRITW